MAVLLLLGIICACIGTVIYYQHKWGSPSKEPSHDVYYHGATGETSNSRSSASAAATSAPAVSVSGLEWKWGQYHTLYIAGTAVNNSGKNLRYAQVEINLYDKNSNVVGSTLANINNLGPGQTWKFEAPVLKPDEVQGFQLKGVSAF